MLMRSLSENMEYPIKNRQLFGSTLMPLSVPFSDVWWHQLRDFLTDVHMHATVVIC